MEKGVLYRITVSNFNKYNSKLKKGHKCTLISNNFCNDSKLGMLPITTRWMFLGIILTCGDFTQDTVEMSAKELRSLLECNRNIDRELDQLQSLQLLSYDKIDLFLNRIEKNRIEKKRISKEQSEKKDVKNLALQPADDKSSGKLKTSFFISTYCKLFKEKYSTNPEISQKDSGIAKRIANDLSEEKIELYLNAYFQIPDAWIVKIKHPISAFETKKNEIVVFANSGKFTTRNQSIQIEKDAETQAQLDYFDGLLHD